MKREIVDEADVNAFVEESCDGALATTSSVRSSDGCGTSLPRICSNGRQLRDISREALRPLQDFNHPPVLFVRSGMIVAIVHDEKKRQVISEVGIDALCGRLARCADYFKVSPKGDEYDCSPPPGVVKDILALPPGEWNFPPLDALTETPIIRPDGSILDTPGYDSATRLYYSPDPGLSIPALSTEPSRGHIEIALHLIHRAIGEFPYADQASYANAIAGMLTPIIKPAIDAPAPLAIYSSNDLRMTPYFGAQQTAGRSQSPRAHALPMCRQNSFLR